MTPRSSELHGGSGERRFLACESWGEEDRERVHSRSCLRDMGDTCAPEGVMGGGCHSLQGSSCSKTRCVWHLREMGRGYAGAKGAAKEMIRTLLATALRTSPPGSGLGDSYPLRGKRPGSLWRDVGSEGWEGSGQQKGRTLAELV